jgi:hypothetical protein
MQSRVDPLAALAHVMLGVLLFGIESHVHEVLGDLFLLRGRKSTRAHLV